MDFNKRRGAFNVTRGILKGRWKMKYTAKYLWSFVNLIAKYKYGLLLNSKGLWFDKY